LVGGLRASVFVKMNGARTTGIPARWDLVIRRSAAV